MSLSDETKKKFDTVVNGMAVEVFWINFKQRLTVEEAKQLTCNQKTDVENKLIKAAEKLYDSLQSNPRYDGSNGYIPFASQDLWTQFLELSAEHHNR